LGGEGGKSGGGTGISNKVARTIKGKKSVKSSGECTFIKGPNRYAEKFKGNPAKEAKAPLCR